MNRTRGFTLLELMISIAIIAIITAIAIPSFLGAQKSANESHAVKYLRSWSTAQEQYRRVMGSYAHAAGQLADKGYIQTGASDSHGYSFSLKNPKGSRFTWWGQGVPTSPGSSGNKWFFIDSSGVIRSSLDGPATSASDPIGGE